jgi:hypothetical protein
MIVGLVVGIFNGLAGMILSISVGLLLTVFFVRKMTPENAFATLRKSLTKIPFILKLVYMIGVIAFMSIFSAEISKGGLFLPTGHYPSTFVKYLSITVVLPENFSGAGLTNAELNPSIWTHKLATLSNCRLLSNSVGETYPSAECIRVAL